MKKLLTGMHAHEGHDAQLRLHQGTSFARGNSRRLQHFNIKPLCAVLIAASLLSACGGGGGSNAGSSAANPTGGTGAGTGTGSTTLPTTVVSPEPVPASTQMTMSCVDGPTYQCSGSSIIRSDNGVALTSSGVQAYGRSTSDLATPNTTPTTALGFAPASGGTAEIRLAKSSSGVISGPVLLLSDLGLSWDGESERPLIIETFSTELGRVQLNESGAITFGALPASSDLTFYDFATLGARGTQANYANNAYFPRTGNPSRCPADVTPCPDVESAGLQYRPGDWRTGGSTPDWASASRLHADADIHAGNAVSGASGTPALLPGGTGVGVPFPGAKGYRTFETWSLQHANLAGWVTQDTVRTEEWAALGEEHNKNRRGMVAFGAVTDPDAVPINGTASYSGIVHGWYVANATDEPSMFHGKATVTVNFATRQVSTVLQDTVTHDAVGAAVPLAFETTAAMGAAGTNVANYLTGPVDTGSLSGGISGRYFGPVSTAGTSGTGPAEIAGVLSLSDATSGATVVGGFVGLKQ